MSDQPLQALPPESRGPLPWHQVWIKALTQPSENTFSDLLAREPDPSLGKAFGWIALSSLIGGAVVFFLSLFTNALPLGMMAGEDFVPTLLGSAVGLICAVPIVIIVTVIGFALYSGVIQVVARILGGQGTYDELTYAFAAYGAPLGLASAVVSAIPFVNFCLSPLLAIYGLVLNVMAVKAVHRFDWGRAIVTSLSLLILSLLLGCCVAILVTIGMASLGPSLEEWFPELMRQIESGTF
ncbi:MAG TPA: Yip1 family protein [Anaerolineales bacterium]|nr:Yip1 family protein [Anaerolineales bacterium]